jgi:hypothetical protein
LLSPKNLVTRLALPMGPLTLPFACWSVVHRGGRSAQHGDGIARPRYTCETWAVPRIIDYRLKHQRVEVDRGSHHYARSSTAGIDASTGADFSGTS